MRVFGVLSMYIERNVVRLSDQPPMILVIMGTVRKKARRADEWRGDTAC